MKTAEQLLEEAASNLGYGDIDEMLIVEPYSVVRSIVLSRMQSYADQFKNEWVSVEDRLPEYGLKVIVARPNEYSGKTDVLIGRHHKVEKGGTTYGRMDNLQVTYKDYWSLPSTTPFEDITYWQPLPSPPKTTEI